MRLAEWLRAGAVCEDCRAFRERRGREPECTGCERHRLNGLFASEEWQEFCELVAYVLPGAFGPEMSIRQENILAVLDLYGFGKEEKVALLWMLSRFLAAFRDLEAKALRRTMRTKGR